MEKTIKLGRALKLARRAKNMTLKEVAAILKTTHNNIGNIELGRRVPGLAMIEKLEKLYETEVFIIADIEDTTGEEYYDPEYEFEVWKPIEYGNGKYSASNLGRIKSDKTGRIKKQYKDPLNYMRIRLAETNDKYKGLTVHRLIAKAFIPNPENKPTVNHINGNPSDNRVINLEWATMKEQNDHKQFVLGKSPAQIGEANGSSKLTEKDVLFILNSDKSVRELKQIYHVASSTIYKIKNKQSWIHIRQIADELKKLL